MARRDHLFSIAPHGQFLKVLAARVAEGILPRGDGPFGLADVTIFVPTRRARLALADAFADLQGGALMLPDIRTFGGEAADEEPFLPPFDMDLPPPAMGAVKRRLMLAQLVETWIGKRDAVPFTRDGGSGAPNPAEVMALADSLGELIDDCAIAGITPAEIAGIPPENLSKNWQNALDFLNIALRLWPGILAEQGEMDGVDRRNKLLNRQANALAQIYGDRPVIAAGSTGSIAATAALLKAVMQLPNGAVVLPGLDTGLSQTDHEKLLVPENSPHGHPQYGLARLLRSLGQTPANVVELAQGDGTRAQVLRQALALASDTAHWRAARAGFDAEAMGEALDGVSLLQAHTDEEQARAIALAARQALVDEKTVGIISPDQNLARRIAAELSRFGIEVDDSAGTPLFLSRLGRLLRQMVAVLLSDFGAVELVGLLRNRHVALGRTRGEIARLTDMLELALLRGQRPAPGITGLREALGQHLAGQNRHVARRLTAEEGTELDGFLADLEQAFAPATVLRQQGRFDGAALAAMLQEILSALRAGPDGSAAAVTGDDVLTRWFEDMAGLKGRGPQFTWHGMHEALRGLTLGYAVRNPAPAREDIAIWGQLEARLQNPDLLILGGLNEGIWPEDADPGPWLSRGMRMAAGLEPPERRHGLAAHDFEMAFGNARVLLCLSDRAGTGPAVPSRLVQRLEAFIEKPASDALRQRGQYWVDLARRLDDAGAPQPAGKPVPNPPADLRPKSLRVTEIETLIRSPYDLYAAYVLKLKQLDALGEDPGIRDRGTLIHEIFGSFINAGHDVMADDAPERLRKIAVAKFALLDAVPARQTLWMRRFETAAEKFISYERRRNADVAQRHAERDGRLTLPGDPEIGIRGRADRVDILKDGTLEIIDFKTGGVPGAGEMKNFMAPQLLVEAAMGRTGGFAPLKDENGVQLRPGIAPADASQLTYIKIAAGPDAFQETGFKFADGYGAASAADELVERLSRHADAYLRQGRVAMAARVLPDLNQRYRGAYEHLARTAEWTVGDGEEGE